LLPSVGIMATVQPRARRTASGGGSAASHRPTGRRWSQRVTETSDALDLEPGVFRKGSARAIARSLKRSADRSRRRKADAFRSAMSMLTFYVNRAGKGLAAARLRVLDAAKDELRLAYGRPTRSQRVKVPRRAGQASRKATAVSGSKARESRK
jgi:Protein of unknown function (DUF3175)